VIKGEKVNLELLMKLIQSTTVMSSLNDRKSQGSSGISEQKRMVIHRMKKIDIYQKEVKKRSNNIQNSLDSLNKKVKTLIK